MTKTEMQILRNAIASLLVISLSSGDEYLEKLARDAENVLDTIEKKEVSNGS